jgi:hypothetical protein
MMEMEKQFFEFIKERHSIYIRRTGGDPWPWTKDPILQQYKFTNIFRELDTGTIFCRECIREPYADNEELFFNVAWYRLFNWIPTYQAVGFVEHWDRAYMEGIVRARRDQKMKIFTGAHMLSGTLGGDKIHQIVDICIDKLWVNRQNLVPVPSSSLQGAFQRFCSKSPGFGPFIAYEVITDLRWTRYLKDAPDIMTWANPGPGAIRGMTRMMGLPVRGVHIKKLPKEQYISIMQQLLWHSYDCLPDWIPGMEMRDIEHSLCEFDKYERTRLGEGRPRSKFIPPHLRLQV